MSKLKNEIKSIIAIIIIVVISIFVLFLVQKYIPKVYSFSILIIYFICSIIIFRVQNKIKNKILRGILNVLTFPYFLIYILLTFSVPIFILGINFIIFLIFSSIIPFTYKTIDQNFYHINITKYTDLYLCITIPLMTILIFHKYILKIINYINENNYGKGTNFEKFKINELANYVFDYKTIKFLIYTTYFTFLFIYSIYVINGQHFLTDSKNEKVILQSFISFIAFDRLVSNIKDFTITPSGLLDKLIKQIKD